MSTGLHDYTRDDTPFGDEIDPEDFVIAGSGTAQTDKSADQIEKENSFVDMPPGEHLVIVSGFGKLEKVFTKVALNGRIDSFNTNSVLVRFALPDNPKCTITDFFVLPPADDNQLRAYFEGVPEGKKAAGWAASKFIHFINRLGFTWAPGQPFPDAARKLGNWKDRPIILRVEAARPYRDTKTGEEKMGRPNVRSFSYRPAGPGQAPAAGLDRNATQHASGGQRDRQESSTPMPRPALAGTATGLDDI